MDAVAILHAAETYAGANVHDVNCCLGAYRGAKQSAEGRSVPNQWNLAARAPEPRWEPEALHWLRRLELTLAHPDWSYDRIKKLATKEYPRVDPSTWK